MAASRVSSRASSLFEAAREQYRTASASDLLESYFGSAEDAAACFNSLLSRSRIASEEAAESYFGSAEDAAQSLTSLLRIPSDDHIADRQLLETAFGSGAEASPDLRRRPSAPASAPIAEEDEAEGEEDAAEAAPSMQLLELPCELLEAVLDACSTRSLIALAPTCRTLRESIDADERWERKALARFGPLFEYGWVEYAAILRPPGTLDKDAYFRLNSTWLARAASGGITLLRIEGLIIDATSYLEEHPGGPELIRAASGGDATQAWRYVAHSQHAHRLLRTLHRPQLEVEPEGHLRHILYPAQKPSQQHQATGEAPHAAADAPVDFVTSRLSTMRARFGDVWAFLEASLRPESLLQSGQYEVRTGATSSRHTTILGILNDER